MRQSWLIAAILCLLFVGFTGHILSLSDPALEKGSFRPRDNRKHRLGSMSFAQTSKIIQKLEKQRRLGKSPQEKAFFSVKLADLYVARKMLIQAQKEVDIALKYLPHQVEIKARKILVTIHQKQKGKARHLLRETLKKHPNHPELLHIQKMLE